ncbi:hypothetical protein FE257_005870 [Aspergillus nanangensis]|uniref:Uncharacterized protein n=1 Tax=Aspergillus nanangensis TaxID=2582783 RepID=A0AAD4CPR7_ASPNN|nr:hypothetical protein FE257_005870 [Aspergillus nanangensis]
MRVLAVSTLLLSTWISQSVALPHVSRDVSIPGPPSDPKPPSSGDGIGEWGSEDPGIGDYLDKTKFYGIARTAGTLGLDNAKNNMMHYLGNSGDDQPVTVENMLNDLPDFSKAAKAFIQNEATKAYESLGSSDETAFVSKWENYYAAKDESWDWFFAIGGFSYSVSGTMEKVGSKVALKYRVHVFDRYNWDDGKSVDIGPFHFEDRELGELHLKGIAQEYVVRGTSGTVSVSDFKPGEAVALPGEGGRERK